MKCSAINGYTLDDSAIRVVGWVIECFYCYVGHTRTSDRQVAWQVLN